jgi:SulP family sulfate permease
MTKGRSEGPADQAVVLDAETIPAIDVTASHLLIELSEERRRQGKRLVLARQIGQVREILATERAPTAIEIYPSVQAAVEALRVESQTEREW